MPLTLLQRAMHRLWSFRSSVDGCAAGGSGCARARVVHGAGGAAVVVQVVNAMTSAYLRARPAHDLGRLASIVRAVARGRFINKNGVRQVRHDYLLIVSDPLPIYRLSISLNLTGKET